MTNRSTPAIAFALLLTVAGVVTAQDQHDLTEASIEDLLKLEIEPVFGASRRLQPVTEAPASVTIVTADDIARYGYRTLADVLRGVRGLYVSDDRNYSYLGVRGVARPGDYNSRILLLVDGHRMNDNVYDQAAVGTEFGLDPAMFQRVEVIRGPASSLYGTSAFLAVVNVIMRSGASLGGGSVQADLGTFGARGTRAAFGRRLANGVDWVLSGNYQQANGPKRLYFRAFDAPETNHGIADGLDDESVQQVFGRVALQNLTFTGSYGRRVKGIPTASYDTVFNDPRERTTDERAFVDAQYERTVHAAKLTMRGYVDRYHYAGSYPLPGWEGTDPVVLMTDYGDGTWWGADARLTRSVPWRQTLTVGGEFRNNIQQDQGTSYGGLLPSLTLEDTSRVTSAFVQDEVQLHRRVLLNVGARYDAYDGLSQVTPRAAVIVTPSPTLAFKYLYGTAFRAPNAYELTLETAGIRRSLEPETIATHELVWEQYVGKWMRSSVSAYTSGAERLISLITDDSESLAFVNKGRIRATGLELETEMRLARGIQGLASYAVQQATDQDTNLPLTNSPRHLAKVRMSVPGPVQRSFVSTEVQYISGRRTLKGNTVEPVALTNVTLIEPIGRSFEVFAGVRNLFDQQGYDPGSEEHLDDAIQQNGRTVRLGLRWIFGTR
jgi:iron complex outermembrane receptor protein